MSTTYYRLRTQIGKTIYTVGVDWGPKGLEIVNSEYYPYVVLKQPGHTGWAGIGSQRYYPTEYMLVRFRAVDDGELEFKRVQNDIQAGHDWRSVIAELTQKAKELRYDELNG